MRRFGLVVAAGLGLGLTSGCMRLAQQPALESRAPATATNVQLAPGLDYRRADQDSSNDALQGPVKWFLSLGVVRNPAEADAATVCAGDLQLQPRLERFVFPGSVSVPYAEMLVGAFSTRAEAEAYLGQHRAGPACTLEVKASRVYPADHTAPIVVHVLSIDPARFKGQLITARADGGAAGRSRPSALLAHTKALAATNGGFFVMESVDGIVGGSTGISIIAGVMNSEPTKGRPWALIKNGGTIRIAFHDKEAGDLPLLQMSDGRRVALDGINREPGLLRNCGALRDKNLGTALHDITCRPQNEIVALTGSSVMTKAVEGWLAYRFAQNSPLVPVDFRITAAPGDILLVAVGDRRPELAALAASHQPVRISWGAGSGETGAFAVNGGPMLLMAGASVLHEDSQGWPFADSERTVATAMHRFISLRAPRTALGVTASGQILIVVVDGWRFQQDGDPVVPMNGGMTIAELRNLMRNLGARDALNLDGGGSSVMAFRNGVISHPSDKMGERAVGDALLVIPKQ